MDLEFSFKCILTNYIFSKKKNHISSIDQRRKASGGRQIVNSPENLTNSRCPSFFSVAVRKYPETKQLSGKVSFVSPFQVTVHSFKDIKVSGTPEEIVTPHPKGKQRKMNICVLTLQL